MELEVLGARGIPQSGVLSISVGGTRKQIQLSATERPLRFPSQVDGITQIKVDVLDVLGRARLPYQLAEQRLTVPLEGTGAAPIVAQNMEVDIVMRPCDPMSPSGLTEEEQLASRLRKEGAANGYLEDHDLVNFMQFCLHSLMQDKPADPYQFLQNQVDLRRSQQAGATSTLYATAPLDSTIVPPLRAPLLTMPTEQDGVGDVQGLLQRTSPLASKSIGSLEEISNLEREAEMARLRLREDNAKLRETAMEMNLEYEKLMQESAALHSKMDAKRRDKAAAKDQRTQEAYSEIAKLQDEVSQLARENAKLVADLARGREMIDLVRQDMFAIQESIGA